MAIFRKILAFVLIFSTAELQIASTQEYVAKVTAYPENGPFRSGQLVPLQCTITPAPPFPVMYIWRSPTPNHYFETSFPSSTPITTVTINENHPLQGRYFCHVLSASNRTTVAVGHVDIRIKGLLRAIGTPEVTFIPPSSLQFMVESLPEEYSRRRLFNSFSNTKYEWSHNDSTLRNQTRSQERRDGDVILNGNRLTIPRTRSSNAGTYTARIASFGFVNNYANETCATIVLQALRNYAIFQPVEFKADIGLAPSLKSISMITNMHFTSGLSFEVNVNIPLNPIGEVDFSKDSHKILLELKVFYNGEKLNPYTHSDVKRPTDFNIDFNLLTEEKQVRATLELPYPVPDDEGLYELQLYLKLNDVNLGFSPNCSDYLQFLDSYDGLKLRTILIGSATLMLQYHGAPQVMVTATQEVLSADGTGSLPILTCSVIENNNLELLNQLRWVKGSKELALTQESETVAFDTASINVAFPEESHFGTYRCEAISSQDKTEESIHIAERARFSMQLQSLNNVICHDINEDIKQSLMNILHLELEFSLSSAGDGDISSNNFINPSLNCSTDGSNIVMMSIGIIYSNRNGSVTASDLVEMAEEWMNGIRTANGFAFQINRSGGNTSTLILDAGQLVGIVILCLISIVLIIAITSLVTCMILRHKNRPQKQGLPQAYKIPFNVVSTTNHSSVNEGSAPTTTSLGGQSSHSPTTSNENQFPHRSLSSSQASSLHYVSSSIHNEARLLLNVGTPVDTSGDSSLACTPNCAYRSRMQNVEAANAQIKTRNPISSSRQISVQYDYPELQFTAGYSNESMELSDTYDVITTITRNK